MALVIFRADASADIGGGHIYRCLTLADKLNTPDTPVHFICREEKGHLAELITQRGFTLSLIPANQALQQIDDAKTCRQVLYPLSQAFNGIGLIVVDHYQLSSIWAQQLSPLSAHLAVIDDLANREHHCDLLFDQSFGRTAEQYAPWLTPRCQQVIVGAKHALLRPQFIALREAATIKRANTTAVQSVLVNMGAMDPDNVTHTVLSQLAKLKSATYDTIHVILTDKAKHLDSIKAFINNSSLDIQLHINIDNVAALILQADIAIAAAGTSMLERCCLGLPGVLVCIADNQAHIAKAVADSGSAIAVLDKEQLSDKLTEVIQQFTNNPGSYQTIATLALATCNGNGSTLLSERLQQLMAEPTLYLQPVTEQDKMLLYQWQLAPKTRQYARNPTPPTLQQHQQWFDSVINNPKIYFYLVKRQHQPCGFIRLDVKSLTVDGRKIEGLEVSVALSPECYGQGIGHQALLLTQQTYNDVSLLAYIEPDNKPSLKAFAKAGFLPLNKHWYEKTASFTP